MDFKYYILFVNLFNSLFLHGNTWPNSSDNLKKEHWKKMIETKTNLKENSYFFFMNHSLSILQKYEKRSPVANIEMVTELINNISNINARSEQFDAGKLEADIFVMLLSEVIEQANYLRTEKLLNSTQKISKSFERFITKSTIPENYIIKTENLSVLSLRLNKSEKNKVNSSEINSVDSLIDSDQMNPFEYLTQYTIRSYLMYIK
ncbi:hypothetical protein BpHYR1_016080 [Brachionus plicatilis]|uniref:Uncharacterized protein n=1 Tax=Brachionus plicatilis TaxID=10195 RepID=A0A3M7SLP5_BRAPC|nr:hypothetical protein BpHYR1_016080 [Brachionus plicatilis]